MNDGLREVVDQASSKWERPRPCLIKARSLVTFGSDTVHLEGRERRKGERLVEEHPAGLINVS